MTVRAKFTGLDTLRGAAALAVALYHYLVLVPHVYILKSGHLAVDFFFCLSGFVIGHAYEERLREGLSFNRFLLVRVIRFYPFYLMGGMLGLGQWYFEHLLHGGSAGLSPNMLTTLALNVFFVPGPLSSQLAPGALFALNFPAWSLFLELCINIIYGLVVRKLTTPRLIGIVAFFGAAMGAMIIAYGQSDLGYTYATLPGGFLRCGFSFFTGILLFRMREWMRPVSFSQLWLIVVLFAALTYQAPQPLRPFADLAVIFGVSPLIVWLAASPRRSEHQEAPVFRLLGDTSYGLYAIHVPLIGMFSLVLEQVYTGGDHRLSAILGCIFIGALVLVTALINRWVDIPLRRRLLLVTTMRPQRSS